MITIDDYNTLLDKSITKEIRTKNEFLTNVKQYNIYENIGGNKFCIFKNVNIVHFNNDKYYDILFSDGSKVEVKASKSIQNYNTIEIEFARDVPSGINTTQADFYLITDMNDNYYVIKTKKLLKLCKIINQVKKLKYSWCYIIPMDIFILNAIKI
jgi:hypothetical protein